ncbi:unnamed protein product [Effrenium voratum]|nr:unnamed protein product [Effrenium voratum]
MSSEVHSQWIQVQDHLLELSPVAEKMQRRCNARAELENIKEELRSLIPGAPEECLRVAQEMVDNKAEGFEAVSSLLVKAQTLEPVATYGAKMAEKVTLLLSKLDAAKKIIDAEVAPVIAPLAQQLDAKRALSEAERQQQEAAAREAAEREAAEAARKPLDALMEENRKRMEAQQAAEEAARLKREEDLRAEQQAEADRLASEDAVLRMEKECDLKIAQLGANAACAEALSSMLAASVGSYRDIVEGLQSMISSIAAEPADVRLRLIRIRNEEFQQSLGRQPGVWLFLRATGFKVMAREHLPGDLVTMLSLSSGPPNERFLWLTEPDMMNAYDEWNQWHKRMLATSNFLQGLEKVAFQRIAHLGRHGQDVKASEVVSSRELLATWENAVS